MAQDSQRTMPVLGSFRAEVVALIYRSEMGHMAQGLTGCATIRIEVGEWGFLEIGGIPDCCVFEGDRELIENDGNLSVRVSWKEWRQWEGDGTFQAFGPNARSC